MTEGNNSFLSEEKNSEHDNFDGLRKKRST